MSTRGILSIIVGASGIIMPTVGLILFFGVNEPVSPTAEGGGVQLLWLMGGMLVSFSAGLVAGRLANHESVSKVVKAALGQSGRIRKAA